MSSALNEDFVWPLRVYYEDTDAGGIVYHANYLRFMERARTEWLRALGFEQDALRQAQNIVFVITRSDLHYERPARFNDELIVTSRIERLRRVAIEFEQRITTSAGSAVCRAINQVPCVHAESLKPCRIPEFMMRIF